MAICSCLTLVVGLGPLALIPLDHLPCLQGTGDQRWPHIPTQNSKKANIPLNPSELHENPTETHRVLRKSHRIPPSPPKSHRNPPKIPPAKKGKLVSLALARPGGQDKEGGCCRRPRMTSRSEIEILVLNMLDRDLIFVNWMSLGTTLMSLRSI